MKQTKHFLLLLVLLAGTIIADAQTNTFPTTGNVGIGTLTPTKPLQVIGSTQLGGKKNYAMINTGGKLSFKGTGAYLVDSGQYIFQNSANNNYGLFFGTTNLRYEFRDQNAAATFFVNANNGNGYFAGSLGIGKLNPIAKLDVNGGINISSGSALTMNGVTILKSDDYYQSVFTGSGAGNTSYGYFNTAIGYNALYYNTTGNNNTANGYQALYFNITGINNTAIGWNALYHNTGDYNTAIGSLALNDNSTGTQNTAIGFDALFGNTTGSNNTANGYNALYSNYTGNNITANGSQALYSNTTGYNNTANGTKALYKNTVGFYNTANGYQALYQNTTGSYNTVNGSLALYSNLNGNYNTATGYGSLNSNTTGASNTAMGSSTLNYNNTGSNNSAFGGSALTLNSTGTNNSAIGNYSLAGNTTGNYNTGLGNYADVNQNNYVNTTVVGYTALGTSSNQVRIGNGSVTSIGGYANWTNISDGRVKKNIKENVPGLEFINQLKPVTYNLDLDKADKIIQRPVIKDSSRNSGMDENKILQEQKASRMAKEQVVYTGFVAQDVEKVAKSLNYDFSGVDAPKNDKDLYGLRYAEFVVPLVKAVQELSKENDGLKQELKNQNDDFQKQLNDLKNMVLSMQQSSTNSFSQTPAKQIGISSASLEQNIPNPFSNVTSISYFLPTQTSSAKIIITDKTGKSLKEISLNGGGKGTIQIDASTLSGGAYQYSLYVNNKLIDTKQMVSVK